jgi:CRP/FNR family transcriptional regulator
MTTRKGTKMIALEDLLIGHSFFGQLPKGALKELIQSALHKSISSDEIIVHQADIWPYMFLVAKGEVNALKESLEGRTFIATTLRANDIFWGLAFFIKDAPMPVMLQAHSDTEIYYWNRKTLVPIIKENGSLAWTLCKIMISRMQLASEIVEELAFQPVMSRLAGLLLEIFGDAEDRFMARQLTLDDMAAHIGTTREMVCRHLYKFAEKGAIEIRRTELRINDRTFLETQAGKK